jgi:hypothetical protein
VLIIAGPGSGKTFTLVERVVYLITEQGVAGEHFTPRDVVHLMAKLLFLPVADRIESSTYSLYDGACGTGGMLTVAEESLHALAEQHGKEVSIHLFGQEINDETYAICKADLLLKGVGAEAENIVGGADKSTLSADQFRSREFDFMISNPPYGKSWKTDLERMGGKKEFSDPRFIVSNAGDPEVKLITRSSDGQLIFLVNKLQKMKHNTPLGSRIAVVHNGSALFTGDAGQGESNIRRWVLENDWLEAIIALPHNIFYNTGIATYVWVLANKKAEARRGKVQLIDASQWFQPLRRNLGKKNCELGEADIARILDLYLGQVQDTEESRWFTDLALLAHDPDDRVRDAVLLGWGSRVAPATDLTISAAHRGGRPVGAQVCFLTCPLAGHDFVRTARGAIEVKDELEAGRKASIPIPRHPGALIPDVPGKAPPADFAHPLEPLVPVGGEVTGLVLCGHGVASMALRPKKPSGVGLFRHAPIRAPGPYCWRRSSDSGICV